MRTAAQFRIKTTEGLAQSLLLTFVYSDGTPYDLSTYSLRGAIAEKTQKDFVCEVVGENEATITWPQLEAGEWKYDVFTLNTVTGNELPLLRGVICVIHRTTPKLDVEPALIEGEATVTMPDNIDGRVVIVEDAGQASIDAAAEARKSAEDAANSAESANQSAISAEADAERAEQAADRAETVVNGAILSVTVGEDTIQGENNNANLTGIVPNLTETNNFSGITNFGARTNFNGHVFLSESTGIFGTPHNQGSVNGLWLHSYLQPDGSYVVQWEVADENHHLNFNSIDRPTWETPTGKAQMATLDDINGITTNVDAIDARLTTAESDIVGLQSNVQTLSTEVQEAQSTAETAIQNAETAQASAETADGKAVAAQTTADEALENAATAANLANQAQARADAAYSIAETAVQPDQIADFVTEEQLDEVRQTANTALSTGQNAQTTANSAQTAANQATTTANNANSNATAAGIAAQTAQDAAEAAQITANNAVGAAGNAQTTANQAQEAANEALELAQSAVQPEEIEGVAFQNRINNFTEANNFSDHVFLSPTSGLFGTSLNGTTYNSVWLRQYDDLIQLEIGSEQDHLNLNSINRPTWESPSGKEDIAVVSDLEVYATEEFTTNAVTNLENSLGTAAKLDATEVGGTEEQAGKLAQLNNVGKLDPSMVPATSSGNNTFELASATTEQDVVDFINDQTGVLLLDRVVVQDGPDGIKGVWTVIRKQDDGAYTIDDIESSGSGGVQSVTVNGENYVPANGIVDLGELATGDDLDAKANLEGGNIYNGLQDFSSIRVNNRTTGQPIFQATTSSSSGDTVAVNVNLRVYDRVTIDGAPTGPTDAVRLVDLNNKAAEYVTLATNQVIQSRKTFSTDGGATYTRIDANSIEVRAITGGNSTGRFSVDGETITISDWEGNTSQNEIVINSTSIIGDNATFSAKKVTASDSPVNPEDLTRKDYVDSLIPNMSDYAVLASANTFTGANTFQNVNGSRALAISEGGMSLSADLGIIGMAYASFTPTGFSISSTDRQGEEVGALSITNEGNLATTGLIEAQAIKVQKTPVDNDDVVPLRWLSQYATQEGTNFFSGSNTFQTGLTSGGTTNLTGAVNIGGKTTLNGDIEVHGSIIISGADITATGNAVDANFHVSADNTLKWDSLPNENNDVTTKEYVDSQIAASAAIDTSLTDAQWQALSPEEKAGKIFITQG